MGASINAKDPTSGQTALMASVLRGKTSIVRLLLSLGADTSISENDGYTPSHGAGFQGRPDSMKLLLDFGMDVHTSHTDGFYPLHRACWGNEERHTETVRVLLEDANVDPMTTAQNNGSTCLDMTKNQGTIELIKTKLIEREKEL